MKCKEFTYSIPYRKRNRWVICPWNARLIVLFMVRPSSNFIALIHRSHILKKQFCCCGLFHTGTKKTNHQKDLWFDNTFYEFFSWWNPCPFHMRVIRYVWWSWARMHLASLYAAAANIVAVSPRPADVSSYTVSL